MLRGAFLEVLECLPARSVEHTSSADELKSVYVIAIGFGLYLKLRGLVGLLFVRSELVSTSGSMSGYISVTHHINVPFEDKFVKSTRVQLLVCSTFPQLINQTVLEFRVVWVPLHYYSRRQKLAFRNHTLTLWHTNHRV